MGRGWVIGRLSTSSGLPGAARTRERLLVAQIALTTVLLIGAGLFVKSFVGLLQVPLGFDASDGWSMRASLSGERYSDDASLRRYAERTNISSEIREKAVFWLGQSDDAEDNAFLRGLFPKVTDQELKEKILFSLSQNDDANNSKFLGDVARNTSENIEIRKKALFWLGQKDDINGAEIATLYGTFSDREIKEQLIFVLSQKDDKASIDKLIDIAKREPDKELRKKAIFWLSQSDDPRVAEVLASLLEKP
jgi:HEAT repeat protein